MNPAAEIRPSKKYRGWFAVAGGLILLGGLWFFSNGWRFDADAPLPLPPGGAEIIVRKGDSFRAIGGKLVAARVLDSRRPFAWLAWRQRTTNKMQPGIYTLRAPLTLRQLHDRMVKGEPVKLTVPEGFRIEEIANRLEALRLIADRKKFIELAQNSPDWLTQKFGLRAKSLEGLLWPQTFFIAPGESEEEIIGRMIERYLRETAALGPEFTGDPRRAYQTLILASMIEKEAVLAAEKPLIASVYHNRLKQGMLLQCDATVQYGSNNWKSKLTKADLQLDTPWNTYLHKGLPPTPICSPGLDSLRAALHPADSDYLFYSAKGDGSHVFSKTNAEHNENVRKYLRSE